MADRRGVMGWSFDLAPAETKNITLAYQLKWPADHELVMDTLPDVKDSPLASVERKQQADIARHLINETLEATEKAVFIMHFGEELPLDVITRMLNLTNASGAKAYLVSAKRKLDRAAKRWKARA